ncbi:UvrD-helicase domain-containing protein [Alteromonas lipotrueiana]|uniref:UvrD-helicase domain-containing protein n=1 Tax=Alteromonas lipotrueiana TaxID=2803815 RepID=UPI001C48201C|nr:UvrD-helicase domain-containing protein [Alteromonas lipotrueiana]
MDFQQVFCQPIFLARWLGAKTVRLEQDHLVIGNNEAAQHIKLSSLNAYPHYQKGVFGARWQLDYADTSITLRWLSKSQLVKLHQHVEQTLTQQAVQRVKHVHRLFVDLAGQAYLRDSQCDKLARYIAKVIALYRHSLPVNQTLTSTTHRTLNKLQQVHPLSDYVQTLRQRFELRQKQHFEDFFALAEQHPLTEDQQDAVVRNNDRNLVLAAAGTGKTSVMVAKALYLIQSQQAKASEILILAYNSAAAKELQARLALRAASVFLEEQDKPTVMTFHALGRHILKRDKHTLTLSALSQDNYALQDWARRYIKQQFEQNDCLITETIPWLYPPTQATTVIATEQHSVKEGGTDYLTLNGEKTKSYPHWLIANWLYVHGIDYRYRPHYSLSQPENTTARDYRPTFLLTDQNTYLVYSAANEPGPDISTQRQIHRENRTTLLEVNHQQWQDNTLVYHLAKQVGPTADMTPLYSGAAVFSKFDELGVVQQAVRWLTQVLGILRTQQLKSHTLEKRLMKSGISNATFWADALHKLDSAYQHELSKTDSIDFDDMISQACTTIAQKRWQPVYKHILVDEFQDISALRMQLLQQLIEYGPSPTLTAVGDDWQSIYRFSGGLLTLTTRFEAYLGSHSLTLLQKTFRYNSSIAHTAGTFVMQNPEQYKKNVVSAIESQDPQVFLLDDQIYGQQDAAQRVKQIVIAIRRQNPQATIAIMARYQFWLTQAKEALQPLQPENLHYWTFHSAKGLEADHCILLGFDSSKFGFPGENKNDALTEALLPTIDLYPHSEERRLCYVALTRARQSCYIIADPRAPSVFVDELRQPAYRVKTLSERFDDISVS